MARLNIVRSSSVHRVEASSDREVRASRQTLRTSRAALSPSPAQSSDKENQENERRSTSMDKGKDRTTNSSALPTPTSDASSRRQNKRMRIGEYSIAAPSAVEEASHDDGTVPEVSRVYDPDQAPQERRMNRKNMRDLSRRLNECRDELLKPNSDGLHGIVREASALMKNVLQPSDATIDSRLLVSASDLTLKKATQLVLGEDSSGVDVDEFVSKCITLMRYGAPTTEADGPPPSSRRPRASGRRSTTNQDDSEDEDEDDGNDGDAFDWALLGEKGCIPYNCRPPVRSFLLGPLSVRKKVRASQPRRPRLVADDRQAVSKPEELKTSDLTQNASSNLSAVCSKIHRRLKQVIEDGQRSVETEASDAISEIELSALMRKHHVTKELAVPLFDFAINPTSFGQTVENLFYISFLIREGKISIEKNEAGLPTVRPSEPRSLEEQRAQQASKYQAVFSLDWPTWKGLIAALELGEPLIPHRHEEMATVQAGSWYG